MKMFACVIKYLHGGVKFTVSAILITNVDLNRGLNTTYGLGFKVVLNTLGLPSTIVRSSMKTKCIHYVPVLGHTSLQMPKIELHHPGLEPGLPAWQAGTLPKELSTL